MEINQFLREFGGSDFRWWLGASANPRNDGKPAKNWFWNKKNKKKEKVQIAEDWNPWAQNEPNNNGGGQWKLCMWNDSLKWGDYMEGEQLHFICEYDDETDMAYFELERKSDELCKSV